MSNSNDITRSSGDVERDIGDTRCDCGGAWKIIRRSRTVEAVPDQDEVFDEVDLRCEQCGNQHSHRVRIVGAAEHRPPGADPDRGAGWGDGENLRRPQHYFFAHRLLPLVFFREPEKFIELLSRADGADVLRGLWDLSAEAAPSSDQAAPLSADGLGATATVFCGRPSVVIELPSPKAKLEAHFIALLFDEWSTPRYLVLEDTDRLRDQEPRAVLCEWMADGSRCNHEREIVPEHETFIALVAACLRREAERQSPGAGGTSVGAWNPDLGESPFNQLFPGKAFRAHPCVFAFEILPAHVRGDGELVSAVLEESRAREVLAQLWREAGTECRRRGQPESTLPASLGIEAVGEPNPDFLLIRMPRPLAPPEPYYAAVRLTDSPERRVYTLEMTAEEEGAPVILGLLETEEVHSIIGHLASAELEPFLQAVRRLESGQEPELAPAGDSLLEQLMLYAMLEPEEEESGEAHDG